MNKKCLLFLSLFSLLCGHGINAQSYRDLYNEAKSLLDEGKLEKSMYKFQQVTNYGNTLYYEDSMKYINWIERVLRKPERIKPFGVSETEVFIPYQGGQDVITINGNGNWTAELVEGDNDWCHIRSDKGKVYIISDANDSSDERSCIISVSMDGKVKLVTVKNEKAPEILVPSVENITFPFDGETNTISIHSNTDWNMKDVPGWMVSSIRGDTITLTALPNDNNIERKASIKIEGETKSVTINIFQSAGLDHLAFSKNDLLFGPDGGDEYITVYTDAKDWKFGDFPHWCQISKVADNVLQVHCTPNDPINLDREASVTVTTGRQTLGIKVYQEAKPFIAMIPDFGIDGKPVSFGISAGFVVPSISATSGGAYTGSPVNYSLGNQSETVAYTARMGFSVGAFADMRLYKNLYLISGANFVNYSFGNRFNTDVTRIISGLSDTFYLKGSQQNNYYEEYSFNLLELPVLISYRFPITKLSHIQLNVGPVISYGLSSKMQLSGNWSSAGLSAYEIINHQMTDRSLGWKAPQSWSQEGEFKLYGTSASFIETNTQGADFNTNVFESSFDASPLKRLNCSALFGISYELAGIRLSFEYNLMFTNMANSKFWEGERWKVFHQDALSNMSGYSQRNNYFQIKLSYCFRY